MSKYVKAIFDSISNTTIAFLKHDISLDIEDIATGVTFDYTDKEYISAVSFSADIKIYFVIYMDRELSNHIYKIFFPMELEASEKLELLKELPKEIANTIAGLSISSFPVSYQKAILSPPIDIDKNLSKKFSSSKQIRTNRGIFTYEIFVVD